MSYTGPIHEHCGQCFRSDCSLEPDGIGRVSCGMVDCPAGCGLRIHVCKMRLHKQVCGFEQIPCIYEEYGCVATFSRRKRSEHLSKCPAYVVNYDGESLRRDEFYTYAKLRNDTACKDDIKGKCPLEQYGCKFTYTKMKPAYGNDDIIGNISSFTLSEDKLNEHENQEQELPSTNESHRKKFERSLSSMEHLSLNESEDLNRRLVDFQRSMSVEYPEPHMLGLLGLPVEVLGQICLNLDSCSMNNLSMTCHILRDICCSFLHKKGMLIPVWTKTSDGTSWEAVSMVIAFSSFFKSYILILA